MHRARGLTRFDSSSEEEEDLSSEVLRPSRLAGSRSGVRLNFSLPKKREILWLGESEGGSNEEWEGSCLERVDDDAGRHAFFADFSRYLAATSAAVSVTSSMLLSRSCLLAASVTADDEASPQNLGYR